MAAHIAATPVDLNGKCEVGKIRRKKNNSSVDRKMWRDVKNNRYKCKEDEFNVTFLYMDHEKIHQQTFVFSPPTEDFSGFFLLSLKK